MLAGCSGGAATGQEKYDLGLKYLEKGDYTDAILAFTVAIELDPKLTAAYLSRGEAFCAVAKEAAGDITDPELLPEDAVENYENALADYRKAIELDQKNADAYLSAAELYRLLGKTEDAVALLNRGYETTGDRAVQTLLQEIQEEQPVTEPQSPEMPETSVLEESQTQQPVQESPQPETPVQPAPEQEQEQEQEQQPPVETVNEQQVYTDFFNSDGYDQILDNPTAPELISYCFVDFDQDGVKELLVEGMDSWGGLEREQEGFSSLLDIENGTVVVRETELSGVAGSSNVTFLYNRQTQKIVVAVDESDYGLQGSPVGDSLTVYDNKMQNVQCEMECMMYTYDFNSMEIDEIRAETSIYIEGPEVGMLTTYKVNGQYVTEQEFTSWTDRFAALEDPEYQPTYMNGYEEFPYG